MDIARLRALRLRAHRLTDPAASVVEAARHQTATQAQEFWGGRWALAARTAGEPGLGDVDAAFDSGELVRSWTQRGTLHIVAAADLPWMMEVTGDRQLRQYAGVLRNWGIDDGDVTAAERVARRALAGGERLTRAAFAEVLAGSGVDVARSRAQHFMTALAIRRVLVLGPVVPREGAPTREQYVIAFDEAVAGSASVADPHAELFVRYIASHGPATIADFAWWTGLALGAARVARETAGGRVVEVDEGLFAAPDAGGGRADAGGHDAASGEGAAVSVIALPAFEEYYISYRDRSVACAPAHAARVGPTLNGLVRPVLLRDGEVVGAWSHSMAQGKHHLMPTADPFVRTPVRPVRAALQRVHRFVTALAPAG